jgi:hypothetical protein
MVAMCLHSIRTPMLQKWSLLTMCCLPLCFASVEMHPPGHAGGSKTWLATDDTFLEKNFKPGVGRYYGLYLTEKSGATREFMDEASCWLAQGVNSDQYAVWWNNQMWSKHAAACEQWMLHLEHSKSLYFRSADSQDAGEELEPAATAAPQQPAPQQRPQKLQQQPLKSFFTKAPHKPKGAPAQGGQAGRNPAIASSSSSPGSGGQEEREREQLEQVGPFNEHGFPLKLVMPEAEILCPGAASPFPAFSPVHAMVETLHVHIQLTPTTQYVQPVACETTRHARQ